MSNEIRQLPAVEERVETGPVAFGDDWPGIFIRGDNCAGLLSYLSCPEDHFLYKMGVNQLKQLLASALLKS